LTSRAGGSSGNGAFGSRLILFFMLVNFKIASTSNGVPFDFLYSSMANASSSLRAELRGITAADRTITGAAVPAMAAMKSIGERLGRKNPSVADQAEPEAYSSVNPRPFGQRSPPAQIAFPAGFGYSSDKILKDAALGKAAESSFEPDGQFKFTSCLAGSLSGSSQEAASELRGTPGTASFGSMSIVFANSLALGGVGKATGRRGAAKITQVSLDVDPPEVAKHGAKLGGASSDRSQQAPQQSSESVQLQSVTPMVGASMICTRIWPRSSLTCPPPSCLPVASSGIVPRRCERVGRLQPARPVRRVCSAGGRAGGAGRAHVAGAVEACGAANADSGELPTRPLPREPQRASRFLRA